MTKLGLHANRSSPHLVSFVRDAKPRLVKFLDHDFGTVKACRIESPQTMLIGRFFVGGQPYQHPRQDAQELVRKLLPTADRFRGLYEAWESYNELEPQNPEEAKLFNEFHVHFAEFMHREGLKTIAYNFSTGVPKLELWRYYQDGAEASDYIGLHEYDAPTMDRLHKGDQNEGGHWLALRYRRVWDLLRAKARKPIIITECGIDGGVINDTYLDDDGRRVKKLGYKDFARFNQVTVADYMAQLQWYDDEMRKDDYLVGAAIFCFGADIARWQSFDFGDDEGITPGARDALKRLLQRPLSPARPVDVFGAHVNAPQTGQPPADQRDPETIPAGIPPMPEDKPTEPPPEPPPQPPEPEPPEPKPEPARRPPCAIPVASWFAAPYDADPALQEALGCPTAAERSLFLAEQHFQNGAMLYRGDTKTILVLLQWGAWSEFADTWNSDQPEGGIVAPPPGLVEPKRGFGNVWRTQLGGANAAIGFATASEQGMTGQLQPCEHGVLIHNGRDATRALFANGKFVSR